MVRCRSVNEPNPRKNGAEGSRTILDHYRQRMDNDNGRVRERETRDERKKNVKDRQNFDFYLHE